MPLPVSHSFIGASVAALLLSPGSSKQNRLMLLLFCALLANVPDLDFLMAWGLHLGTEWHRGFTHSFFFAVAAALLMFAAAGFSRARFFIACGAALLSHGVLDFLTTKDGGGVELLFPFSNERFKLGVIGVSEFERGFYFTEILKSGFIELIIFAPVFLFVLWVRGYIEKNNI